jgi:NAD(P)-dependent dehydrogenase (short-subunit alcohol dehydrogenase family)
VTASSAGIGNAIAQRLVAEGCAVLVHGGTQVTSAPNRQIGSNLYSSAHAEGDTPPGDMAAAPYLGHDV